MSTETARERAEKLNEILADYGVTAKKPGVIPAILATLRERCGKLEEALKEIAALEDCQYGFYHGGDPRKFMPDGENSEKELADHKAACAKWDEAEAKGEKLEPEPDGSGWISPSIHVTRSSYGMGVYSYPSHAARIAIEALASPTLAAAYLKAAIAKCGGGVG